MTEIGCSCESFDAAGFSEHSVEFLEKSAAVTSGCFDADFAVYFADEFSENSAADSPVPSAGSGISVRSTADSQLSYSALISGHFAD